ncbi:hypothetical protein [Microbulbifer taiwanensis]|uniref:hypothetical protein n=1 Tax=Microbulbifer taiwanensis TaxID=986746 RepID=UPI00362411F2
MQMFFFRRACLVATLLLYPCLSVAETGDLSSSNSLMTLGGELLHSARALQAESVSVTAHSNALRKELNRLRVKLRSLPAGDGREALGETIDLLAQEIPSGNNRPRNCAREARANANGRWPCWSVVTASSGSRISVSPDRCSWKRACHSRPATMRGFAVFTRAS